MRPHVLNLQKLCSQCQSLLITDSLVFKSEGTDLSRTGGGGHRPYLHRGLTSHLLLIEILNNLETNDYLYFKIN